jgi:acyl-CoA synthetase (AMP-forming)/AMP-acid ligase II
LRGNDADQAMLDPSSSHSPAPAREPVLEFLEGQVARLWLPDDVVLVDALPLGATGKVQKAVLRERYAARRDSVS